MLADGTVLDVANVIWCTGFRPDFGWIELPVIGEEGCPSEYRGVVDSSPGVYFLGIPFLYSFTSMLVIGAGRDAAYIVERVAGRLRTRDPVRAAAAGSRRGLTQRNEQMTAATISAPRENARTARYRQAERTLWDHYGLAPEERFVEVGSPPVRIRVIVVGSGPPVFVAHGTDGAAKFDLRTFPDCR